MILPANRLLDKRLIHTFTVDDNGVVAFHLEIAPRSRFIDSNAQFPFDLVSDQLVNGRPPIPIGFQTFSRADADGIQYDVDQSSVEEDLLQGKIVDTDWLSELNLRQGQRRFKSRHIDRRLDLRSL